MESVSSVNEGMRTDTMQPSVESSPFTRFLEWGLSAIGGAALTLVAFRTKIALIDREIKQWNTSKKAWQAARQREIDDIKAAHVEDLAKLERQLADRLKLIERRGWASLRITADIANKVGVDGRFSDQLMRMLAQEDEP